MPCSITITVETKNKEQTLQGWVRLHMTSYKHCRLAALGLLASLAPFSAALACDNNAPCQVIYTINDHNDLVVAGMAASTGGQDVLRLSTAQLEKVVAADQLKNMPAHPSQAAAPSTSNFYATLRKLTATPTLPTVTTARIDSGTGGTGGIATALRNGPAASMACQQMQQVLSATLQDLRNGVKLTADDFVTQPEVATACGTREADALLEQFQTRRQQLAAPHNG